MAEPPISHHLRRLERASIVVALAMAAAGCQPRNAYKPPPPPIVSIATPLRRDVTTYLYETGQLAPVESVAIVARVQGFLEGIGYKDGAPVSKGTTLFTIEPAPFMAALDQAVANLASAKAKAVFASQQNDRFSELASKADASQMQAERFLADRDSTAAAVRQAQAALEQATITYSYTHVSAPFDGVATVHMQDVGALVGTSQTSQLASLVRIDPIWVTFNISERDAIRARARMASRGVTPADLQKVPIDIELQGQSNYPIRGHLDYAAPQLDAGSGTLAIRGLFANADHVLLPGNFVKLRLPIGRIDNALLVPEAALGSDQGGHTLLVVGADNVVEQRAVTVGDKDGDLRIIASGLQPSDKIIVDGLMRANVGAKVDPHEVSISAPPQSRENPGAAP